MSFSGTFKTLFLVVIKVTGLNTIIGLWKVLNYNVRRKEMFILYTETQSSSERICVLQEMLGDFKKSNNRCKTLIIG